MKSFLKYVLATVVGIIVSSVLLFFVLIIIMVSAVSSAEKPLEIKKNSILYLDFKNQIVDRQPAEAIDVPGFSMDNKLGLNSLLLNLKKAKEDDDIKGIYIEAKSINAGYATIEEIRKGLIDFRESGKFVVFYTDVLSQKAYYLATASDKIFFNTQGIILMNGLRLQSMYLKNAFKKVGIEPVVVRMGKYKGAVETFERTNMSKPNREQLSALVESIWNNISHDICSARSIDENALNEAINNLQLETGQDLLELGMVDSLVYKSDVLSYLKSITGTAERKDLNSVSISKYAKVPNKNIPRGIGNEKIAVIYASGTIIDGEADEENIGGEKFARTIRKARKDSSVKAIVLRVNSPGGSALASEVILDELIRTKGVKPIVVSMGDMAASGGYYISCSADSVIANPNTITGSIGVFFRSAYSNGFFEKLGLTFDEVKTHEHADMYTFTRPYSDDEINYIRRSIENTYELFLKRVAEGRSMNRDSVHEIAQGRVWSGSHAGGNNLVDSYGGFLDAIEAAKKLAGLEGKVYLQELPKQVTALEKILQDLTGGETKVETVLKDYGVDTQELDALKSFIKCQGVVTALPYTIVVE